ncbi:MAG: TonB-dependent receptor [Deltaproteobacteria bacterium]|nr:TonB-dependent receptor [Deltaproteobacteria bacterium]
MRKLLFGCFGMTFALLTGYENLRAASLEPVSTLGDVVVTASRVEEDIAKVPASVTVLSEEDIRQSAAQTVPELLRNVPGVLVNDITGNGRSYTVDLRGFGETASLNTLVLVDGRRINQADLSGVDWGLIPKERVARIEVIRGGRGGVLYGDNASGGVINIITKTGFGKLNVSGHTAAGSYETYLGDAFVGGTYSNLSFAGSANYRTSDGYRDNSDTTSKDAGLNLSYDVSDRLFLKLNGGYHEDDTSLPGALTKSELDSGISRTSSLNPDDFSDTRDKYIESGFQFFFTDNSFLDLTLSKRERNVDFFSFFDVGEYTGNTEIDTLGLSPQLVLNTDLLGHETNVLFGFDYEKNEEDILNSSIFFGFPNTASYELQKSDYGYYVHADMPLTEALSFSAGIRADRAKFRYKARTANTSSSNTLDEELYTIGTTYQFADNSSAYVSYSKSFRFPVLDESFNFVTNSIIDDLDAQTSHDIEAGMRLHLGPDLSLNLNLYYIKTMDEIFYDPAFDMFGANVNLDGDTIRQGIEFSFQQYIKEFLIHGSYTYRDTDIDGGRYDGNELPNVPKNQASIGLLTGVFHNLQFGINGVYVGDRRFISDFDNSYSKLEDYFRLDGKLTYIMRNGSAYVAVNNILNEEYSEYGVINFLGEESFYPSPKANVVAGINFKF